MQKDKVIEWLASGSVSIPNLLLTNYSKLELSEEEFVLLIQIYSFICSGNPFPTPDELSDRMTFSSSKCMELIRQLLRKGFLTIEDKQEDDGVFSESYSLNPLWEKLTYTLFNEEKENDKKEQQKTETNLYSLFEKEFGRPLSPMECESLGIWLDEDQHEPMIIKAALREAVMSGKLNFRYIDRILFEWKKNGIQTMDQVRSFSAKFKKNRGQASNEKKSQDTAHTVPFYNWLES